MQGGEGGGFSFLEEKTYNAAAVTLRLDLFMLILNLLQSLAEM